jgi:hypothetical protein
MKAAAVIVVLLLASPALPQSGGSFSIQQSVIAAGGGAVSGGSFGVEGTSGQPGVVAPMEADPFVLSPGFWDRAFAPTAAGVMVSGRVLRSLGQGLSGATVTCQDFNGNTRVTRTGSFGYFSFSDIVVGETYVFYVESKGLVFPMRTLTVLDELNDLEFLAQP